MSAVRCSAAALFVLLAVIAFSTPALGLSQTRTFHLVVGDPAQESKGASVKRHQNLVEETRERLMKRLRAGEVKSWEVTLEKNRTINVTITMRRPGSWYRALLLSPGKFEVRPRRRGAVNWVMLANELPEGVEIRSDPEDQLKTYLWSSNYGTLSQAIKRVHTHNFGVVMGPDGVDGGWRTFTVGQTAITSAEVAETKREMSGTGITFVSIQLTTHAADRLAAANASKVEQWVVVLDGEVLGYAQTAALSTGQIQLTAPSRATSRDAQKSWATQVVGRLAAPLPIPVALVQE